jgi:hypothetical protein
MLFSWLLILCRLLFRQINGSRAFLKTFQTPSELIRSIFREGLTIIGWVGLWHPVEMVLYDWIPIVRSNAIHRFITTIPINIFPKI